MRYLPEVEIFPENDPDSEAIWYLSFVCSASIKVDLKHARIIGAGMGAARRCALTLLAEAVSLFR